MFRVRRELELVGSVVINKGKPVSGSSSKREKASWMEVGSGPFVVALSVKEKKVPRVKFVRYSLKKDESVRVTVPGKAPLTPPVGKTLPRVPFVEKPEIVTVLEGGPPSIKSKASCAGVPERVEVLTFTTYVESARVAVGTNTKIVKMEMKKNDFMLQLPLV
jgi:hypothetical protein